MHSNKPTDQQLNVLAHAVARRLTHNPEDVEDLVQEGLWTAHCAFLRTPNPRKPFAFARTVIQRTMLNYLNRSYVVQRNRETLIDSQLTAPEQFGETLDDRLMLQQYLDALECNLGTTPRRIATNLLTPTDPTFCQFLLDEVARKLKRNGHPKRGVRHIRITQRQLREAFGITRTQWSKQLKAIRLFTRAWLHTTGYGPHSHNHATNK